MFALLVTRKVPEAHPAAIVRVAQIQRKQITQPLRGTECGVQNTTPRRQRKSFVSAVKACRPAPPIVALVLGANSRKRLPSRLSDQHTGITRVYTERKPRKSINLR